MKTILLTIMMMFSLNSFASNWVNIGDNSDGTQMSYDLDSIVRRDKSFQFNLKAIFPDKSQFFFRFMIDCKQETAVLLSITHENAEKIVSMEPDRPTSNSPLEAIMEKHCKGQSI